MICLTVISDSLYIVGMIMSSNWSVGCVTTIIKSSRDGGLYA